MITVFLELVFYKETIIKHMIKQIRFFYYFIHPTWKCHSQQMHNIATTSFRFRRDVMARRHYGKDIVTSLTLDVSGHLQQNKVQKKKDSFCHLMTCYLSFCLYAASQTTVSHMKRINQAESPIFVIFVCSLFPKAILFDCYFNIDIIISLVVCLLM